MKKILLLPLLALGQQAFSQGTWTFDQSIGTWGTGLSGNNGSMVTNDDVVNSDGTDPRVGPVGWTGFSHPDHQYSWGSGYGPIDAVGVWQSHRPGGVGQITSIDGAACFDLSATGSTVRLQAAQNYSGRTEDGESAIGTNHLFEFGLIDGTSGMLGDGTDAIWIAARETTGIQGGGDYMQSAIVDLDILTDDIATDTNMTDSNYTYGAGTNLTTIQMDGYDVGNSTLNPATNPNSIVMELAMTNLGGGQMQIDLGLVDVRYDTREAGVILSQTPIGIYTQTVTHGLTDLTNLKPALGAFQNDGESSSTGATWDWEDEYIFIPEPSSMMLAVIAFGVALGRRKR